MKEGGAHNGPRITELRVSRGSGVDTVPLPKKAFIQNTYKISYNNNNNSPELCCSFIFECVKVLSITCSSCCNQKTLGFSFD